MNDFHQCQLIDFVSYRYETWSINWKDYLKEYERKPGSDGCRNINDLLSQSFFKNFNYSDSSLTQKWSWLWAGVRQSYHKATSCCASGVAEGRVYFVYLQFFLWHLHLTTQSRWECTALSLSVHCSVETCVVCETQSNQVHLGEKWPK